MTCTSVYDARSLARTQAAFRVFPGPHYVTQRQAEIAALPQVWWKGKLLYTLRCHGETGKGPHNCNVPERILWALIDLRGFRCPYHA